MARKVVLAVAATWALAIPIAAGIMHASPTRNPSSSQNHNRPADTPKWEAVSIKPCPAPAVGGRGGRTVSSPGRTTWNCQSVAGLIQDAYRIKTYMIDVKGFGLSVELENPVTGGPSWIRSDRYLINAKAEGTPGREIMSGPMLQALLEDRFKLKIHWETRDVPVYALTAAKGGSKLQPFKEGSCTPLDFREPPLPPPAPGEKRCRLSGLPNGANYALDAEAISLDQFAGMLISDRKVVNKTGITGLFDFHLEYALDYTKFAGPTSAPTDDAVGPSIFAVLDRLGLKLEAAKGPGEFLLIDSVERPSEN